MASTSLRTQIYLPEELRKEIDSERFITGESLAGYLRKAAAERVEKERKKKLDLSRLAEETVGSLKGYRSDEEIRRWLREIKEERTASDRRLKRDWREVRK